MYLFHRFAFSITISSIPFCALTDLKSKIVKFTTITNIITKKITPKDILEDGDTDMLQKRRFLEYFNRV